MAQGSAASLTIDKASTSVGFTVRHWGGMMNVTGKFTNYDIEVELDSAQPANSKVELRVDAASVSTGSSIRDSHLRSKAFFDVDNYPVIIFTSRRVDALDERRFGVEGVLTVRGESRAVGVVVHLDDTGGGSKFTASSTVKRKDFGLNWNMPLLSLFMGDFITAPDVNIKVEGRLV